MKKILVIAILTVFIAGSVFAQSLTLDGYFNSGLGLVVTDAKDAEDAEDDAARPQLRAFGVDSESQGYRFRLNGSYQNEERTAGARFRFQSQRNLTTTTSVNIPGRTVDILDASNDPTGETIVIPAQSVNISNNTYGYLSIPYMYGWANLLENKLYVAAGLVDDGTYATADWWYNDDQTEGLGVLVRVAPIDGLSIGVGAYTISQASGGSNNILAGGLPNFRDRAINLADAKYTFNLAYTMPEVVRVGVSYRTKNKAASGWSNSIAPVNKDYDHTGAFEIDQLIGEVRILAVKDLTAVAVAVIDNPGASKWSDDSMDQNIILSETFAYKVNDELNVGFNAVQFLYNSKDSAGKTIDYDPSLLFNAWGSYTIGSVIPRLDLVYMMGGNSILSTTTGAYHRKGFEAKQGDAKDKKDDYSVFSVRPSVRFNVGSRAHIEVGNMLNFDSNTGETKDANYGYVGTGNKRISNVFYLDFRWNF